MLNELKKVLSPPYKPNQLYSLFFTLFIILVIPLTILGISLKTANQAKTTVLSSEKNIAGISVKITSLTTDSPVSGVQNVQIEANDKNGVIYSVSLLANGHLVNTVYNSLKEQPFNAMTVFNSNKFKNGETLLTAMVSTDHGVNVNSTPLAVSVVNTDTEKPVISFENLTDGASLSKSSQEIALAVTDNTGVNQVALYVDTLLVKSFTSAPYNYTWNLDQALPGIHKIAVVASDFVGNTRTSTLNIYKAANSNLQ